VASPAAIFIPTSAKPFSKRQDVYQGDMLEAALTRDPQQFIGYPYMCHTPFAASKKGLENMNQLSITPGTEGEVKDISRHGSRF